jgi:hypothetical protein
MAPLKYDVCIINKCVFYMTIYGNLFFYHYRVKDQPYLVYFDILTCAQMGAAVATAGCPTPQVKIITFHCRVFNKLWLD